MQEAAFDPLRVRNKLVLTVAASVSAAGILIVFSGDNRVFFTNWTVNAAALAAFALSIIVTFRQGMSGLFGRAHAALAIGLALWLAAELVWTYYELGVGIEEPFPSPADALWLTGYAPIAYYSLRIYRTFGHKRTSLALAAFGAFAVFAAYVISLVATAAVQSESDAVSTAVSVAYPLLDCLLAAPAILVLSNLKNGRLTSTPWALLSFSLLVMAAADSGFAYDTAAGLGEMWVWDVLYNTIYIMIAATLFWHNRFFVFDKNRAKKIWQQENR
jgi:hypothetical protein